MMNKVGFARCQNPQNYSSINWCGKLRDEKSPWGPCINTIDKSVIKGVYDNCLAELCNFGRLEIKTGKDFV